MLAWVALFAAATYLPGSAGPLRRSLLDVAAIVMPAVAAALCRRASSSRYCPERRDRWAWRSFALGFLLSTLAEATWAFYEVILAQESPTPSVADVFYVAFYLAMFAAILLLVRLPRGRFTRLTILLDSLLFTLGLAGLGRLRPRPLGLRRGLPLASNGDRCLPHVGPRADLRADHALSQLAPGPCGAGPALHAHLLRRDRARRYGLRVARPPG